MVKRIIFLVQSRFNLRNYERFGIELLKKNGFEVEIWDITPVVYPNFTKLHNSSDLFHCEGLKIFNEEIEIQNKLAGLSKSDFVMTGINYNFQTLGIYQALSRSDADYAFRNVNIIPQYIAENHLVDLFRKPASLRRLDAWRKLFMKLPVQFLGVRAPRLILIGGNKSFAHSYPMGKATELLQIHALDYDLYLKDENNACTEKPIAVFLDQVYSEFDAENIIAKTSPPITSDKYCRLINSFFDLVENKTGLEVVIAAHPRSRDENLINCFKGRRCIKGKTINLIKECKLVLGHWSTSLNFAALFYKPVIFMTCSDFYKDYEGNNIDEFAKWFGKRPIFIDRHNNIDWQAELNLTRSHYDGYRRAYIKAEHTEDLPFWQIVANRLKRQNN